MPIWLVIGSVGLICPDEKTIYNEGIIAS